MELIIFLLSADMMSFSFKASSFLPACYLQAPEGGGNPMITQHKKLSSAFVEGTNQPLLYITMEDKNLLLLFAFTRDDHGKYRNFSVETKKNFLLLSLQK